MTGIDDSSAIAMVTKFHKDVPGVFCCNIQVLMASFDGKPMYIYMYIYMCMYICIYVYIYLLCIYMYI